MNDGLRTSHIILAFEERYIQVDTGGQACKVLSRNIFWVGGGGAAVKTPEKIKSGVVFEH
jgi:hypothetical protein